MKKILLRIFLLLNIGAAFALILAYLATHISPNTQKYLYFFGLAYPYILWVNLGFILLWLFVRKRLALISVLTILLGINHFFNYFSFSFSSGEPEGLRVSSFNAHVFNMYDLEDRDAKRDSLFQLMGDLKADIYCFQEFYNQGDPTDFPTMKLLLKQIKTDFIHEGYTHQLSERRAFGVVTFSKYPIVNKGEVVFTNDAHNNCIYSDIKILNDTIRVYNAHLGSIRFQDDDYQFFNDQNGPKPEHYLNKEEGQRILSRLKIAFEKRAIQAELVAEHCAQSPYPTIVCMDLNDTPVSYAYRQFNRLLKDAFTESSWGIGETYIGKMPSNRIDYIFHSETLSSSQFTTHQVNFSDHKPISCYIQLN